MYAGAPTLTARLAHGDTHLDITIVGYQYPRLLSKLGDEGANYLDIVLSATDSKRRWRSPDRYSMLNWEVVWLALWIEKVATGRQYPGSIYYGEEGRPSFRLSDDSQWLEVEILPGRRETGALRFPADTGLLSRFAAELKLEVAPFRLRIVERCGEAHAVALRLGAFGGALLTALSLRLEPFAAVQLDVPDVHTRASRVSNDVLSLVGQMGGMPMTPFLRLLRSRRVDPRPQASLDRGVPAAGHVVEASELRAVFSTPFEAIQAARWCLLFGRASGIPLQIGVDFGRTSMAGGEHSGSLQIASQIGTRCPPGHILASEAACELAAEYAGLEFTELGQVLLDGADGAIRLYGVR